MGTCGAALPAVVLYFGFGLSAWAYGLVAVLVLFAFLEAAYGLCVGCQMFALLMRVHVIPEEVCPECSDLWLRRQPSGA